MKLKYISLKNKLIGGSKLPTAELQEVKEQQKIVNFKNRLNGTPLENNIAIIYNLYLVKKNIRKAFLLELSEENLVVIKNVYEIIQDNYPEFEYTIELLIKDKPHRILIHKPELTQVDLPRKKNLIEPVADHDNLIATLLDFDCKGIPDKNEKSYTLDIVVNEVGVISYICKEIEKFNTEKLINYAKAAEELGYTFNFEIVPNLSHQYILDNLINYIIYNDSTYIEEISDDDIHNLLVYNSFLKILIEDNFDFDQMVNFKFINNNKYLILFIICIEKYKVFNVLYPLSNEILDEIDKIIESYKDEFYDDNIEKFINFITIFKDIFLEDTIDDELNDDGQVINKALLSLNDDVVEEFLRRYDLALEHFFNNIL